jgi:two-component system C4-dicarboxylate transport sensor histidine kinase DctB
VRDDAFTGIPRTSALPHAGARVADVAPLGDAAAPLVGRARDQSLAHAGQLAAATAHEMSGPMACLATNLRTLADGLAALAAAGVAPAADLADAARDALADAARLAELVRSFRVLARPGAGPRVRFDPAAPIADALRLVHASRPGCEVRVEAPAELPELEGTPSGLCHVLLNLLENGVDATGGAGAVRLRVSAGDGTLVLRVADRGAEIPAEVATRMFEPWFTTKAPGRGSGLGLWLSREIVADLGGRIGFESGPAGTTFEVVLPAAG